MASVAHPAFKITGPIRDGYETILTTEALEFVANIIRPLRDEIQEQLRARVLAIADQIRAARSDLAEVIHVNQPPVKCRGCAVREACGQRRG